MKKLTFGTPETLTPTKFCDGLTYTETEISYPTEKIEFYKNARGCVLRLPLGESEHLYGLGLQLKAFDLRGEKIVLRPNADPIAITGDSHAPVPFFVSTAGYGIYVDTARHAEFYLGSSNLRSTESTADEQQTLSTSTAELYAHRQAERTNISIQIPAAKGVDLYIIEGATIGEIVAQYNLFSGGGCDAPDWALSAIYRCNAKWDAGQVLKTAEHFKREGFAVGTIGLEPGWQTRSYSCSYVWGERFPDPAAFAAQLRDMGYHINVWQHAFVHPESPIHDELEPYSGNYTVWKGLVPDFSMPEVRAIFARQQKTLVDIGVDGFKLDECDSSDYTGAWSFPCLAEFPSGLDGEQYHSMFGQLYAKAILEALGDKLTLSEVRNMGALAAPYPFVLYSDLYAHKDFLRGCCTAGFSGLLWTPEVRDARTKEEFIRRLQSNVFSVQCLVNAWYCDDIPWREHGCEAEVKALLALRETLVPMLSAAFAKYKSTGIPPVRALVCDYTADPETYAIDDEYLFCEDLLVAPIAAGESGRDVYLPEGNWRDWFTKEPVASGKFHVETEGIPVYEKY